MSKAILKEVREAIKADKLAEAVEKCEKLLKDEPTNYMAYLLLGAAYQSSNKSEAAKNLRQAIEYAPGTPTVALQGLANCAPLTELPKIYEELLELVPDKSSEYFEKLFAISSNVAVNNSCLEIFKKHAGTKDSKLRHMVLKYMARIWVTQSLPVSDEEEELYQEALELAIEEDRLDVHLQCCKRYIKLLNKQARYANCLKSAVQTTGKYPNDVYAFEWICKIYCENYANAAAKSWWDTLLSPISYYAQKLLALNPNSGLALLVEAIDCFGREQFLAARELLQRVLVVQHNYNVALELLARTEMALGAYELAYRSWQKCTEGVAQLEIAVCMSHTDDMELVKQALGVLVNLEQSEATVQAMARCYFKLADFEKLEALPSMPILAKLEYQCSPSEAITILTSSDTVETFDELMLLGRLQLNANIYTDALTSMLKATRLRPYRSQCFYYLGKIYYNTRDITRARKCFEKCVHINPMCEDAIKTLSAIYQQLGEEDLNIALLLNTLKHIRNENKTKAIYYKLGLHYLSVHKFDDAIQSFRTAIKIDVSCISYWESLGDAYCERGSYNSAIRVFQKILELDPENIYAQLQIAVIKTTVRNYTEAIDDFDKLLNKHADYLPGLKGAAEAHIGLASNLKQENRYGRCKAHLQSAVNHLQRAFLTPKNQEMVWLWRLTANVFVQTAQMPNNLANLDVSGKLAKRDTESMFLDRKSLLELATRFYTCTLKLKQNTFLWYEFALCSYYCAQYMPEEADAHLKLATKACHMAIQEQNDRWQNWNLLGVISMHKAINNLPLAQHCFIQALQLERKSYTSWTNLGALYIKLGDIKLANQSFQRAQQSSPIYPNAWIGQAMIAETVGEEEEAIDLYRHCQQFELHVESALGYAHWVCNILTDSLKCQRPIFKHAIENMHADVVALDAINWYSNTTQDNACIPALTFQGFLNARQKLYRPAVQAYQQAARKATAGEERDKLFSNLGYLYLKLDQPLEAIKAFNSVCHANFKPIIGLALAYFRAGQHAEAYSVYSSVLKSVTGTEDGKAALILVAMASMVYASQGEADTKTILYQCILLKDSPIQALFSACALGILHNDNQLTETILNELKKYENSQEHCAHIAYLRAQHYLANQQARKGLTYIVSRVHIFPSCVELRKVLANYLLDNFAHMRQYQVATSNIALGAIHMGHHSKNQNSCLDDSESLLIASRALEPVDRKRSLKLVQRAIHLYPQSKTAWSALLKAH